MVPGKGMMFSVSLLISVVDMIGASPYKSDATTVQGDFEKSNRQNRKQAVKWITRGYQCFFKAPETLYQIDTFSSPELKCCQLIRDYLLLHMATDRWGQFLLEPHKTFQQRHCQV